MPKDSASLIELYAWNVEEGLPLYDEGLEVVEIFVEREMIENALQAGVKPSPAELLRLEGADRMLIRRRRRVIRHFPELFSERTPDLPLCYWWWYLDEGPQVRQLVKEIAHSSPHSPKING